ncbi:EAL and HDOD domain-containing protein [Maridesulfovibrio bastinii]|uniref:EAL and HDOD domain-containing protein n=1 Tax=Maridesulfovibrio bastinii TaxID=47157 RepID=UPI00041804F0|nr:HDOD domain-containing protein [Maridesulfovibrio bastinii]
MSQNLFINSFFVARQPVFDVEQNIWGYELLFRNSGAAGTAEIDDEDEATSQVIADGFGLVQEDLHEKQKILINFPRNMLLSKASDLLPPETCIVEILENVEPDEDVLTALKHIRDDGFQLALDDFVGQPGYEQIIDLADIVKVDCLDVPKEKLEKVVRDLRSRGVRTLLAEKVEDKLSFRQCLELGFDLFQGFFFSKPEIMPGEKLSSAQFSRLELLREISNPEFDLKKLTNAINSDVSISYRLLRFINSASFGIANKITSISQAVNLLGQKKISGWLRVILLSDMGSTSTGNELAFLSIKRAKFLELLSRRNELAPHPPETMFLLGLFSLLDALLNKPINELLDKLPLADEVSKAICCNIGDASQWLKLVVCLEKADWGTVSEIIEEQGLNSYAVSLNHHAAMQWAHEATVLAHSSPE